MMMVIYQMDDLTVVKKQKAWLYITDTLTNISIISSQSDLGMDAYLQAACTDIQLGKECYDHCQGSLQIARM